MIEIRKMRDSEIGPISHIDRSETIARECVVDNGALLLRDVRSEVPHWFSDGRPEHSIQAKIEAWKPILEAGGTMWGAFGGETLVGFAVYRPDLTPEMAQFAGEPEVPSERGRRRSGGEGLQGGRQGRSTVSLRFFIPLEGDGRVLHAARVSPDGGAEHGTL